MRVDQKVSRYIVDRRKRFAGGVIAILLAVFGVKVATSTGTDKDPDRDLVFVVSTALDRGQGYWESEVPGYRYAQVVLFDDSTQSGCGIALTSTGPFWCSADDRIYLDLQFLRAIPGDLGKGIVIGHELAHHVQQLEQRMNRQRATIDIELEADCLAGRWVNHDRALGNLDPADIASAIHEIETVGDDRVCGANCPEQWRHGTSAQRVAAVLDGVNGRPCW